MSAYNAADYLDEAVKSMLDQTFKDFEFLIIDDGSKDATPSILAHYAKLDPRVIVITQEKNKGLIAALNAGFLAAKGKYIARMDADDVSMPNRLQKQFDYLEANPDVMILGAQSAYMDENGEVYASEPFLLGDEEIRKELLFRNQQFRHGVVLIRQSIVSEHNEFYNPSAVHYEDFDYWPRILSYGKGANLTDTLYLYRRIPTSLTATKKGEMRDGSASVMGRERLAHPLSDFGMRDVKLAFKKAAEYKPAKVTIRDKSIATNLKWCYQSYLVGLAQLYYQNKSYKSAFLCGLASLLLGPLRFISKVIGTAFSPSRG